MKPESHVTDQIPAYALNIMTAAEAAEVAAHLTTCPVCQSELQAYEALVGELAMAVPQVTLPPNLKAQLLQEIKEDKLGTAASHSSTPARPQTSWWSNWRIWLQKRPLWQPVLVVVVLALLLISNVQLRQQLEDAHRPANFGTVTLSGTEFSGEATGILIISADGEHGTLVVQNLPVLPETETYQLWLRKGDQRTDGGTFNVDADGYRAYWVQAPEPLDSYEIFGVTIEPAGGSPGPTGEKVLGN